MSAKQADAIHGVGYALKQTTNARFARALMLILTEMGFSLLFPLIKHNMGERRISFWYITIMSGFALALAIVMQINPTYMAIYLSAVYLASAYHTFEIQRKNYKGILWHSFFHGFSIFEPLLVRLPFGKNFWAREIFLEPLLIMLIGKAIYLFLDPGLGGLIGLSSMFMVIRGITLYRYHREEVLDQRDAMIEAEYALSVFEGASVQDTAGFTVPNVSQMRPADKQAVARSMLSEKDFATLSKQA